MVKLNEEEKRQKVAEETKAKEEENKEKENKQNKKPKKEKINASLEDLDVILYPLVTEKAVNMIDGENKITFIVNNNATKTGIKKVAEKLYSIKIDKINIIRDRKGKKKAIIKLNKEHKAQDVATKLGIL